MSAADADFGLEISRGVIAKFIMAAIGFAGSVVFARVLGPSGYGAFYIVLSLVHILDNPVTGWGVACKKRITEPGFPTGEALGCGLLGAITVALVIIPAVYIFNQGTGLFDLEGLFIPFSGLFLTVCLFAATNRILSARSNFAAADWSDTLRSFLTTPIQLAFVLLGLGAAGMVYGLTIATLLTVPYVLYRINITPVWPSRETLSSIAAYAKYSVPNGFISTAQSRFDILLLGVILTSASVGDYQVAMQLTLAGTFIGDVMANGLMARISENWSNNSPSRVITDLTNSLGFASILAIPIFFGAAAMPNDVLVTVFGPQYSEVGTVLVGLALYRVISVQSSQLRSTVNGLDQPDVNTRIGVVVLVLNVGLGYILLLEIGIVGVVIATILSEIVRYSALSITVKQSLPEISIFPQPLGHQIIAGMVMFIVVDRLHRSIGVSWWGELGFLVGIGSLVYFLVLTAVSEPFRVTVRGVIADALTE